MFSQKIGIYIFDSNHSKDKTVVPDIFDTLYWLEEKVEKRHEKIVSRNELQFRGFVVSENDLGAVINFVAQTNTTKLESGPQIEKERLSSLVEWNYKQPIELQCSTADETNSMKVIAIFLYYSLDLNLLINEITSMSFI